MGDLFGIFGAALFIISYFFVQRDKEFAKTLSYSLMNLSGATLMLVSVGYDWNMGAVINNSFWIVLSAYGLWDFYRNYKAQYLATSFSLKKKNTNHPRQELPPQGLDQSFE